MGQLGRPTCPESSILAIVLSPHAISRLRQGGTAGSAPPLPPLGWRDDRDHPPSTSVHHGARIALLIQEQYVMRCAMYLIHRSTQKSCQLPYERPLFQISYALSSVFWTEKGLPTVCSRCNEW